MGYLNENFVKTYIIAEGYNDCSPNASRQRRCRDIFRKFCSKTRPSAPNLPSKQNHSSSLPRPTGTPTNQSLDRTGADRSTPAINVIANPSALLTGHPCDPCSNHPATMPLPSQLRHQPPAACLGNQRHVDFTSIKCSSSIRLIMAYYYKGINQYYLFIKRCCVQW
jgi:hypothetical protein